MKAVSYPAQYARNSEPLLPLLPIDNDMAVDAAQMEQNAARARDRFLPADAAVSR